LGPLGRFHELSIPTADIRESVEFYERLGFTQAQTGDAWRHPYGVLTDGRIVLGLHQQATREPAVTFVRPDVARHAGELERSGYQLDYRRTGADEFHEVGLRDPAGQLIIALEARTYSPPVRDSRSSLCGEFAALGLPARDFEAARQFWEPLGFVAGEERESPFAHVALVSDTLDIVLHRVRALAGPTLIFTDPDPPARIALLREAGLTPAGRPPAGLDFASAALFEAPEGTRLLLLGGEL
jgi:catechol 2,3-dioxygenase-like lactoylglutathione lyase family enzyme